MKLKPFIELTRDEWDADPRFRDPGMLTNEELMAVLEDRYRVEPIPPCRVCGGKLSISSAGGGQATEWHCSYYQDEPGPDGCLVPKPGREFVDDHWHRSRWVQHRSGDRAVLELIQRFPGARQPGAEEGR